MTYQLANDHSNPLMRYGVPVLHGLGWLLYAGTVIYVVIPRVSFLFFVAVHGVYLLCQALAFYGTYFYLTPRLLVQQKYLTFWTSTLLVLAGLLALSFGVYSGVNQYWPDQEFKAYSPSFQRRIPARLLGLILITALALFSRLIIDWVSYRQQRIEAEKERLQNELAFLRAQLNPHFLLNTLNSVYALALKQSPQTPDVIMKLAQLMRYLLYETNYDQIPLCNELEAIVHYIDLQELRLSAPGAIDFTQSGPVEATRIAPFLLLPLIENMFKHGRLPMSIQLKVTDQSLQLQTRNGLRDNLSPDSVGGIGLSNLRRRLLILYPARHELVSSTENSFFQISLTLKW